MNALARRQAAGFRTDRLIAIPRGHTGGDWLLGMQRTRSDFLRSRRAWPHATKLETTAYGFARRNATERSYGFGLLNAKAERIAAQRKFGETAARFAVAHAQCMGTIDGINATLRQAVRA